MHLNRALAWLQMGDFERGWPEYEWRLKCRDFAIPPIPAPRWDGSPLEGQTILLYADHGFGDTIQFIRYAPLVSERGGRVIVACQKPIARLVASCPGVEQVVAEGLASARIRRLRPADELAAGVRNDAPLGAGSRSLSVSRRRARSSRWQARIGFIRQVSRSGSPGRATRRTGAIASARFGLPSSSVWRGLRACELVSFQRIHGVEQLGEVQSRFAVTAIGGELNDFMDIAAAMQSTRSDDHSGYVAGSSCRGAWVPRLACAVVRGGLAMAAGPVGQSVVSFDATVSTDAAGRLGRGLRANGGGAAAGAWRSA